MVFCTIVLITGPIWARPVWGIWWTWDARLTTTLVLWLIYVSYLVLRTFAAGGQTPVLAAALAIFGFVDVPIVYMSIRWFRTQHPSPVMGGGENSGLDPAMLHAFLWNLLAFTLRRDHPGSGALPPAKDGKPIGSGACATGACREARDEWVRRPEGRVCRDLDHLAALPAVPAGPVSPGAPGNEGPEAVFMRAPA